MSYKSIIIPQDILGDEVAILEYIGNRLTQGARLALMKLDLDWRDSKEGRFSSSGAQFLWWHYNDIGLVEKDIRQRKPTVSKMYSFYRLTPLGLKVKHTILRQEGI